MEVYTNFCINVGKCTPKQLAWLRWQTELSDRLLDDMEGLVLGEDYESQGVGCNIVTYEYDPFCYVTDQDGEGDIERATTLVCAFMRMFEIAEPIIAQWADVGTKPTPDSYSGGAVAITAQGAIWISGWNISGRVDDILRSRKRFPKSLSVHLPCERFEISAAMRKAWKQWSDAYDMEHL